MHAVASKYDQTLQQEKTRFTILFGITKEEKNRLQPQTAQQFYIEQFHKDLETKDLSMHQKSRLWKHEKTAT